MSHLLQVELCVIEGRDLAPKDLNGKSDPYCDIFVNRVGNLESSKEKTKVIWKNLNPVWNESFIFDDCKNAEIVIHCWDKDKFSSDDFMGTIVIDLDCDLGSPIDEWIPVQQKDCESYLTLKRDGRENEILIEGKHKISGEIRIQARLMLKEMSSTNTEEIFERFKILEPLEKEYPELIHPELVALLLKCINQGHTNSMIKLGELIEEGNSLWDKDTDKALEYYQRAGKLGNKSGFLHLGQYYVKQKKYKKAIKLFKTHIEYPDCCYELACLYQNGKGVSKDEEIALDYFLKNGNENHIKSAISAAKIYENSSSRQNLEKAFKYYKIAEELDSPEGMFNVGLCYLYGKGIEQNIFKAAEYFVQAGEEDYPQAYMHAAVCYRIRGETKLEYEYGKLGAKSGDCASQFTFGQWLLDPKCSIRKIKKGAKYLEMASKNSTDKNGIPELACFELGHAYQKDILVCTNQDKKIDSYYQRVLSSTNYITGEEYVDCHLEIAKYYISVKNIEKSVNALQRYEACVSDLIKVDSTIEVLIRYAQEFNLQNEIIEKLLSRADNGNNSARYLSSRIYAKGFSVDINTKKANKYMKLYNGPKKDNIVN